MLNLPSGLLHRHGDEWSPMELAEDREHRSPDDSDYERRLKPGRRIYRCTECDVQIGIDAPDED